MALQSVFPVGLILQFTSLMFRFHYSREHYCTRQKAAAEDCAESG